MEAAWFFDQATHRRANHRAEPRRRPPRPQPLAGARQGVAARRRLRNSLARDPEVRQLQPRRAVVVQQAVVELNVSVGHPVLFAEGEGGDKLPKEVARRRLRQRLLPLHVRVQRASRTKLERVARRVSPPEERSHPLTRAFSTSTTCVRVSSSSIGCTTSTLALPSFVVHLSSFARSCVVWSLNPRTVIFNANEPGGTAEAPGVRSACHTWCGARQMLSRAAGQLHASPWPPTASSLCMS